MTTAQSSAHPVDLLVRESLESKLAICHRMAVSLKQAFTSRDRTDYFEHHPRAFGSPGL